MKCDTCKEERVNAAPVPYIVHESMMARLERANLRLWIALLVLVVLLVGTNAAWLIYEKQFETVHVEQDSTEGGYNNFIGNDGDIYNGEADNNLPSP